MDLVDSKQRQKTIDRFIKAMRWKDRYFAISAITGDGCRELAFEIMKFIESRKTEG